MSGAAGRRGGRTEITTALGTEFGAVLAQLVAQVPGARGAVLSDREGYTVDHGRDSEALGDLDLQLAGAQLARPLTRLAQAGVLGHRGWVLVEGTRGNLLAATVATEDPLFLVLVLARRAHLGRAIVEVGRARSRLRLLLS